MFLGYRIHQDLPRLEELGEGTFSIDLLTGNCTKDDRWIEPLLIATEFRVWLGKQLARNGVDVKDVEKALITTEMIVEKRLFKSWVLTYFLFKCTSLIHAFGREYYATKQGERELG